MTHYREFGDWFNSATSTTMTLPDKALASRVRRAIAEMEFLLQDAVVNPVRREFPELIREDESES